MDNRSTDEIQNDIDNKDKEISQIIANMEEIHQKLLNLKREKIELDVSLSKAKYLKEKLKIERSLLSSAYWHNKNQGL